MSEPFYGQRPTATPAPIYGYLPPVPPPRPDVQPPVPPGPQEPKRGSKAAIIIPWCLSGALAIALALVLILGGGTSALKPTKPAVKAVASHTITIDFVLTDPATVNNGCTGTEGYDDIGPGTPVTVTDSTGAILGASSLGVGEPSGSQCTWELTIPKVPDGKTFYSAEVGRRGKITESAADLKAADYTFSLTLGN